MTRTEAREIAMRLLFQLETQNNFTEKSKDDYIKENIKGNNNIRYVNEIYEQFNSHEEEVDAGINRVNSRWGTERMAKTDLASVRLAILEILYMDDIPIPVSINEAVEIAKKYGTDRSGKVVNGILREFVRNLERS